MASKYFLSGNLFHSILKHLVNVEEGKKELLEEYFVEPSIERNELETILDTYIDQLNEFVRNVQIVEDAGNELPFVIIGSEVKVQDLDSQEIYHFRIVSPFEDCGFDDASYLSPVGKALLLKKVGEVAVVKAPGGVFQYEIRAISFIHTYALDKILN